MSETGMLVLAGLGLGAFYIFSKDKKTTVPIAPPPPNYSYPTTQGQPTPFNPGQWGGPIVQGGNASGAQDAASIIGAIGGLASGIGSVVRGISDWGSGSGSSGNGGYSDVLNWP